MTTDKATTDKATAFDRFSLDPDIIKNILRCGFETPTPIQDQGIPLVLEGRDLIGLAQTGTGKTAAFILPLLQRLRKGPQRQLRALVLVPTRELAAQTVQAFSTLGRNMGFHAVPVYGGVGMQPQIVGVRRGAEVVVACPGRLLDHLRQKTISLSRVEYLVIDEADRMFDMGFLPDVREIISRIPTGRQTLLFSATMPDEVRRLTRDMLRNPATIQIAHSRPAESVSHAIYPVQQADKTRALIAILEQIDRDSVLVFTRTRHRAKRLTEQLIRAGHPSASLQGGLSQRQRDQAMAGFRSGQYQILVATDLAARGLDVSSISHVINFDIPGSVDDYTHRIGRTGRAAKLGDAFTLVTREDAATIRDIEKVLGSPIERRRLPGFQEEMIPSAHGRGAGGGGGHRSGGRPGGGSSWRRPHGRPGARPGSERSSGHRNAGPEAASHSNRGHRNNGGPAGHRPHPGRGGSSAARQRTEVRQ